VLTFLNGRCDIGPENRCQLLGFNPECDWAMERNLPVMSMSCR
jgi:hypothetical protein